MNLKDTYDRSSKILSTETDKTQECKLVYNHGAFNLHGIPLNLFVSKLKRAYSN